MCQMSTSVQRVTGIATLAKMEHCYLWEWKLPVSSVYSKGEMQPMQIQQVLAVTGGHREKKAPSGDCHAFLN